MMKHLFLNSFHFLSSKKRELRELERRVIGNTDSNNEITLNFERKGEGIGNALQRASHESF